jgi:hypothetical protein
VRLAGTVSVSDTTPEKPFNAVIVIVDVAELLTVTDAGDDAAIVKSTKLKVAVVDLVMAGEVLVPVIVSVKVPALVELQDTVAVPEPVTLLGVMAPHVRPAGTVSVSDTTLENPLRAVTVIVEVAD